MQIAGEDYYPADLPALHIAPAFPRLRTLALTWCHLGTGVLLSSLPACTCLTSIHLDLCEINKKAAHAAAAALAKLPELR
jgi:hypothetical protein